MHSSYYPRQTTHRLLRTAQPDYPSRRGIVEDFGGHWSGQANGAGTVTRDPHCWLFQGRSGSAPTTPDPVVDLPEPGEDNRAGEDDRDGRTQEARD